MIAADDSRTQQARTWLAESQSIAVLTGAGISAESGLPTFRGTGGLWRNFRAEDLATPQAFARDPLLVWEWYDWRRSVHAKCEPNAGHRALAALEKRVCRFTLITQNVDNLHEQAGSKNILHLHGSLWRVRCTRCGREEANAQVPLASLPPVCSCGGMQRPGVVWFGEALPEAELRAAVAAAQAADVFLVVGTSSLVYPAAALPRLALEHGARVIEVNLDATELSATAHVALRGKAGEILPAIIC
jgi:NAD-dependent deacetylase